MKIKRSFIGIILLCVLLLASYSQEQVISNNNGADSLKVEKKDDAKIDGKTAFDLQPNSLGFFLCYPMTGGFSYQRWINKFGIRLSAGGYLNAEKEFDYNAQIKLQGMVFGKDINSWFSTAFYPFVTIAHRGRQTMKYKYMPETQNSKEFLKLERFYYLGGGIATELLFLKHISFTIDLFIVGVYPWEISMGGGGSINFRF